MFASGTLLVIYVCYWTLVARRILVVGRFLGSIVRSVYRFVLAAEEAEEGDNDGSW